jgi:hypothetical protein
LDARNQRTARACGKYAQDWTKKEIYREVEKVKKGEEGKE